MKPRSAVDELVPLADRLQNLQLMRVALVAAFFAYVAAVPDARAVAWKEIAMAAGAYVVGTFLGHAVWHVTKTRNITLFGGLLVVDGFFLAWVTWATGGPASPLRYLVVLHITTVALLASYRTAVRLALWHSLLTILALHAARAEVLVSAQGLPSVGSDYQQAASFIALVWLAALTTAAFAAVNERELRRRKFDLAVLARLADALQQASRPEEVAETLERALIEAYDFSRVVVSTTATADLGTRLLTEFDPVDDADLLEVAGPMRNVLVRPLVAEGHAVGVVLVEHGLRLDSRIARRVVNMVERFCDHTALALRNTVLVEELRAMASTDGLTGVANRRTFDDALPRELARSGRNGQPVSLLLVDLDHFKQLNDVHGHQAGDAVLQAAAAALATASRLGDVVARYGGEEFVVVLPNCSTEAAVETAERLRAAVSACSAATPVTASIGVATSPFDAVDATGLVAAADAALYEAKARGRNCVVSASASANCADLQRVTR